MRERKTRKPVSGIDSQDEAVDRACEGGQPGAQRFGLSSRIMVDADSPRLPDQTLPRCRILRPAVTGGEDLSGTLSK
jgi:hypothetical protein